MLKQTKTEKIQAIKNLVRDNAENRIKVNGRHHLYVEVNFPTLTYYEHYIYDDVNDTLQQHLFRDKYREVKPTNHTHQKLDGITKQIKDYLDERKNR